MKIAAYCTLLSIGSFSLADLTKSPLLLQFGALSLLGWIVWYLLVRVFPQHLTAQKEQREAFLAAQAAAREDFREALENITNTLERLATAASGRSKR